MDTLTVTELLAAIVLIGGALGVIAKIVYPAVKIGDRVSALERHEKQNFQMIQENEVSNKLLCRAMIALIDNRITDNNFDSLKLIKAELIQHVTK